jgi:TRAP-type mannitol/chloroaromatic compound transport system permease small subunit
MSRLLTVTERALALVANAAAGLAVAALIGLLLLTAAEMLLRSGFNVGLTAALEINTYLLSIVMVAGSARVLREGGHIRIRWFLDKLQGRAALAADLAAHVVASGFCGYLSFAVSQLAAESFASGSRNFMAAGTPVAPAQIMLAAGLWLLTAQIVLLAARRLADGVTDGVPATPSISLH